MLLVANRKNLKQYAKTLLGNFYTEQREKDLIEVCTKENYTLYVNNPWEDKSFGINAYMDNIDKILGTFGVENCYPDIPNLYYCNKGDTYSITILHYNNILYIGDWGSIVEKQG